MIRLRARALGPAALLGLVLLSTGGSARADAATADVLFKQAKAAMDEERYDEACEKFAASYAEDRTLGTLLNLANCNEVRGRIATAWAEWGEAVELARKLGDDRDEFASERRAALEPRLPRLTVVVEEPAGDLRVLRDDQPMAPAAYGVMLPVDPGQHVLSVKRDGQLLHQEAATLKEQEQKTVVLNLREIDEANPPDAPPADIAPITPVMMPVPTVPPPERDSTQQTVGFIVGGVGLAGLVVSGVFGVMALSEKSAADEPDACVGSGEERYCTPTGLDAIDSADTFANVSQWVGITSLVAVAVGFTLVVTAPGDDLEQRAQPLRIRVAPSASAEAAGLFATGEF